MPSFECRLVGLIEIDDPISRIWSAPSPITDRLASRHVTIDRNNTLRGSGTCYADVTRLQEQLQTLLVQVRTRM